jgi:hypothetical protein
MGLHDVFDNLRKIACDPTYWRMVEWLGNAWGHPVAPSTPVQDYRLHVKAWQHHFAAIFGLERLPRAYSKPIRLASAGWAPSFFFWGEVQQSPG